MSVKWQWNIWIDKSLDEAADYEKYFAAARVVRKEVNEYWEKSEKLVDHAGLKTVYYFSQEYLPGRLLGNNLMNAGMKEDFGAAMKELGIDLNLLEDMEEVQNHGIRRRIVRFEMKVSENAFVVGKSVRDILWPHSGVVSSIVRGSDAHRIMDNDGEKKLYVGDTVTLRAQIYNEEETVQYLYSLVGNDYDIHSREIE